MSDTLSPSEIPGAETPVVTPEQIAEAVGRLTRLVEDAPHYPESADVATLLAAVAQGQQDREAFIPPTLTDDPSLRFADAMRCVRQTLRVYASSLDTAMLRIEKGVLSDLVAGVDAARSSTPPSETRHE